MNRRGLYLINLQYILMLRKKGNGSTGCYLYRNEKNKRDG